MDAMIKFAQHKVSVKKKRFIEDGFDLDLSYIPFTDSEGTEHNRQIIAMGFPSSGIEATYRNPLKEVQRFFHERHKGHYKIYNLCSEREYALTTLFERVSNSYRFDDHNPCPLEMVRPFCEEVKVFLAEHDENVVAIHCKAGKGRTGTLIACLLVYFQKCSPEEAMDQFALARTHNRKGVTIPSQQRLVHYWYQQLKRPVIDFEIRLTHIRLKTVPNFNLGGGCFPYFIVYKCWIDATGAMQTDTLFNMKDYVEETRFFSPKEEYIDFDVKKFDIVVSGNIKIMFFDYDHMSANKMFRFWFHTGFIEHKYLCFPKMMCDDACKKHIAKFDDNFQVECYFDDHIEGQAPVI